MLRKIVQIDEEKCNGCGRCASACHEGAIEMVNGKARLVGDSYCDGLGNCLPECPTGAITIIEREASAFDEIAVAQRTSARPSAKTHPVLTPIFDAPSPASQQAHTGGGCPGSVARSLRSSAPAQQAAPTAPAPSSHAGPASELSQWPVQLRLVNPRAAYFQGAHLLIAADCTAFAFAAFHSEFIRGHVTLIGCPKLDDNAFYAEKLAEILSANEIASIHVVRMEVPCCGGIVQAVKKAMLASGVIVPYRETVIAIDGQVR